MTSVEAPLRALGHVVDALPKRSRAGPGLPTPPAMGQILTTRRLLPALLAVTAVFTGTSAAQASTYRVDPDGSDAAIGSSAAPFRTINKAATVARRGDVVVVA